LHEPEKEAVRMAERYCDGNGVNKSRLKGVSRAVQQFPDGEYGTPRYSAANAAKGAAFVRQDEPHGAYSWEVAAEVATFAGRSEGVLGSMDPGAGHEIPLYAVLLRDIFGNPFRPVTFSPSWRTDTAVALARQMYESREFSAMPILADALQEAGCDNDDILFHCRDANATHVRGCWVVDLVLGKE
jgi:hypothetical protein